MCWFYLTQRVYRLKKMQTKVIFDDEQTEIFDFYFAASYNVVIHVLDYGNNDTQLLLRVSG